MDSPGNTVRSLSNRCQLLNLIQGFACLLVCLFRWLAGAIKCEMSKQDTEQKCSKSLKRLLLGIYFLSCTLALKLAEMFKQGIWKFTLWEGHGWAKTGNANRKGHNLTKINWANYLSVTVSSGS